MTSESGEDFDLHAVQSVSEESDFEDYAPKAKVRTRLFIVFVATLVQLN